jgi:hypothetical protein
VQIPTIQPRLDPHAHRIDYGHPMTSESDRLGQDVHRRALLASRPWDGAHFEVPPAVANVPGMLWSQERRMLYWLALHDYTGAGVITDMGAYLGASAICFAAALRERAFKDRWIHTFDLFKLGESGAERSQFPGDPPADMRTRAVFEDHLRDYLDLIVVHEGDILGERWGDRAIELMFVDIAKSHRVMDHLLLTFFPALMPSQSLVILQDYLWGTTGPWHHVVMEKLTDYFDYVVDTDVASVVFRLRTEIPPDALEACLYMNIPRPERLELIDRAIEKLDTPQKQQYLLDNRRLITTGQDETWGLHYHER